MEYTVEERREAFEKKMLWWRFPESDHECDRVWVLWTPDSPRNWYKNSGAEYFIGKVSPTGELSEDAETTTDVTSPTLEQKALALLQRRLWWRFPECSHDCGWSNVGQDVMHPHITEIINPNAEYFIGGCTADANPRKCARHS